MPVARKEQSRSVTPAIVRRSGVVVSTAGVTVTLPSAPVAGNLLVAVHRPGTVFANVTPPAGWTAAVHIDRSTSFSLAIWYKVAGASEPASITFTCSAAVTQYLDVVEIQGCAAAPLDQVASTDGGASTVTTVSSGTTPAVVQGDEIAIAAIATNGSSGGFSTSLTNTFKLVGAATNGASSRQIVARAFSWTNGATFETTATWTTTQLALGAMATFKGAVA